MDLKNTLNSIVYCKRLHAIYILDELGKVWVLELNDSNFYPKIITLPKVIAIGTSCAKAIFVCENGEIYNTCHRTTVFGTKEFSAFKVKNVVTNNFNDQIDFICSDGKILVSLPYRYGDIELCSFEAIIEVSNIISISIFESGEFFLLDNGDLYVKNSHNRRDENHEMLTYLASSIDFIHHNLCVSKEGLLYKYSGKKLHLVDIPESFNIVDAISVSPFVSISPFAIVVVDRNNNLGMVLESKNSNKFFFKKGPSKLPEDPKRNTKSARK